MLIIGAKRAYDRSGRRDSVVAPAPTHPALLGRTPEGFTGMPQNRSDRDPFEEQASRPPAPEPAAAPPPEAPPEGQPPAAEVRQPRPGTDALPGYDGTSTPPAGRSAGNGEPKRQVTRAGMIWAAVASALVVLVLLIAFILQNQELVQVKFFGLEGAVALGIALFIAAVGGGVLVAMAGAARIIQLRAAEHRRRVSAARRR